MHVLLKIILVLFIIGVVYFIFSLNLKSNSKSNTSSLINNKDNSTDINLKFFVPLKPKLYFNDKNEYYNYFVNLLNYKSIETPNIDKGSLKLIKKQLNALISFKDSNLKLNSEIVKKILNSKNTFKSKEYYYYLDSSQSSSLPSFSPSFLLPLINKIENVDLSSTENDEKLNENDIDYKVSDIDPAIKKSNNKSQNEAIESVLKNSFTLIQGPPGTGKSKVSVDIISLLNKYPKINKILISGPSNKAVDSLTKTLILKYPELKPFVCRFYSNSALKKNPVLEGEPELKEVSLEYRIYEYLKTKKNKTNIDLSMLNNLELNFVNKNTFNKQMDINMFETKYNKDYYYYRNYYQTLLLNNYKIICATCDASGDEKLNNTLFDVILIDEAAQSNENITLIPIIKGSENCKLVLVGDHKQLGPMDEFDTSFKTDENKNKINKKMNSANNLSMFERLINGGEKYITLNVQYRMYTEIAELPYDILFYKNENVDIMSGAPNKIQNKTNEKNFNRMEQYWNDMTNNRNKHRFVFIDVTGDNSIEKIIQNSNWSSGPDDQGKPIYNQKEIDVILNILNTLINEYNVNPKSIGIITAYAGQKNMLKDTIKNIDNIKNVEVNTVDGYQGDQKDYIIFSTVRSNDEGDIGFLKDDRRVNVALTRAKYGLFILGNRETLNRSNDKTWKDIINYYQRKGRVVNSDYFLNTDSIESFNLLI